MAGFAGKSCGLLKKGHVQVLLHIKQYKIDERPQNKGLGHESMLISTHLLEFMGNWDSGSL